jgi:hypothetical protein
MTNLVVNGCIFCVLCLTNVSNLASFKARVLFHIPWCDMIFFFFEIPHHLAAR